MTWRLLSRVCCGLLAWMAAGVNAAENAPAVRDETGLFTEAERTSLQALVNEAWDRTGVRLQVGAVPFSKEGTLREAALRMGQLWEQQPSERTTAEEAPPALTLLYDRGKANAAVVAAPSLWRRYPADEVTALLAEVAGALDNPTAAPAAEKMLAGTRAAVPRLRRMESARLVRQRPWQAADVRLAKVLAFVLGGLLLLALAVSRWSTLQRRERAERHYFPEVEVPLRLGAPFGGGVVAASDEEAAKAK